MHVSPQPRSYISGVLENRPQPPQPQPRRNRLLPTPASAAAQRPPLGPGPSAAGLAGPAPIRCPLLLQLVKLHPAAGVPHWDKRHGRPPRAGLRGTLRRRRQGRRRSRPRRRHTNSLV
jgi:hypothetical protein